jgi:peptide/nickel transport system ATP-binding protein
MADESVALLALRDYSLTRADGTVVLAELSFDLKQGEILGIVGESGSGKSQLLLSLLGLAMPGARAGGSACFQGREMVGASEAQWRQLRGNRISMLFQDPLLSLHPCLTMGAQLLEVPRLQSVPGRRQRVLQVLARVGLADPERVMGQYPHELSGGMRQRVLMAMALLAEPAVLLADEPTTSLDAVTQIAVLDLLLAARRDSGLAVLLVTHDLGVLARVADRALVLQAGRVVEQSQVERLLTAPASPHAAALLNAARALQLPAVSP